MDRFRRTGHCDVNLQTLIDKNSLKFYWWLAFLSTPAREQCNLQFYV